MARFGAKASKAAEAQSKLKLIEKLKAEMPQVQAPSSGSGPGDARKVRVPTGGGRGGGWVAGALVRS